MRSQITCLKMIILACSIKVCNHARRPVNNEGAKVLVDLSLQ